MKNTKTLYKEKAIPAMKADLGITNVMALPRVSKVVVNAGVGRILKDSKRVDEVVATLETITGQKVVMTKARKAIAGFKTREGLEIGARVTLHGDRMWSFLDRLLQVALPRVRDFQGIAQSSVDQNGNANIGIKEQIIFPEIAPERVQHIFPFQVNIVTTAQDKQAGEVLLKNIGLPIRNIEQQ